MRRTIRLLNHSCSSFWEGIQTPSVVIDERILSKNITSMQSIANRHQLKLRPHVKTHKCIEIAKKQINAGAIGVTCSKVDEACVFIKEGMDCFIAYPVVCQRQLKKLFDTIRKYSSMEKFCIMVDSMAVADALVEASRTNNIRETIKVVIKVDVGLHRCGVQPGDDLLELAKYITSLPDLSLQGICSHAGQAYSALGWSDCVDIANNESVLMRSCTEMLSSNGVQCSLVSVGSTLTELARSDFKDLNEIRPGNYVFYDTTPLRLDLISYADIALTVLATVISVNDQYAIIDSGSKTLSSDMGAHGSSGSGNYGVVFPITSKTGYTPLTTDIDRYRGLVDCVPLLEVKRLSEEHGWVDISAFSPAPVEVGQLVRVVPNHSCPVVNLTDSLVVVNGECSDKWKRWPVHTLRSR